MKEDVYFVNHLASLNEKLSSIEVDRNQELFPVTLWFIYNFMETSDVYKDSNVL